MTEHFVYFRHFRTGKLYEVLTMGGFDATNDVEIVVYRPCYPCKYTVFARTPENFFGMTACGVRRFEPVEFEADVRRFSAP
jgi:hypothetical protein